MTEGAIAFRYWRSALTGQNILSRSSVPIKVNAFIGYFRSLQSHKVQSGIKSDHALVLIVPKWCESKHRAWISERRRPDARATRTTVFSVRDFKSHLASGSNGGFNSACRTSDKFYCGTAIITKRVTLCTVGYTASAHPSIS